MDRRRSRTDAPACAVRATRFETVGNVAFRAGKKLKWDGANLKVTNCLEAEPFVRREYRSGWTL